MAVLVVDDSSTIRRILKKSLSNLDVNDVDEAEDGLVAWTLLKKKQYDLVVTDWNMPNMNGLELVEKIRSEESNQRGIKIIMITTEGGQKEVVKAIRAGVNDYIVKPFQHDKVKEKFLKYLF